jgi:hypothetical protein
MVPDSTCSEETFNGLMERSSHHLVANDVQLDGGSDVSWDINAISLDFARWMSAQHMILASTSRVGILSSFTLTRLLSALIPGDLGPNIRLFIETSSALYNQGLQTHYAGVDATDLCQVRSFTGNKVLEDLEKALNNTALAKASLTKLKALFIILFGTIIAVGYSSQGIHLSNVCFLELTLMYVIADGAMAAQLVDRNARRRTAPAASQTCSSHDRSCRHGLSP